MSSTATTRQASDRQGCGCLLLLSSPVVIAVLFWLLEDARSWLIGNVLDANWSAIRDHPAIVIIVLVILLIMITVLCVRAGLRINAMNDTVHRRDVEIERLKAIINVVSSATVLMQSSRGVKDHREAVKRIGEQILRDLARVIDPTGGVQYRASAWFPNDAMTFLVPIAQFKMPASSLVENRFYIGAGNQYKSGTAGAVFRSGKSRVVHLFQDPDGTWRSDDEDFVPSNAPGESHQYRSFIALPIKATRVGRTIGVLCLDSGNVETFDSEPVQEALVTIAEQIASAFEFAHFWSEKY